METELDLFTDPGTRSPLALPMGYVLEGRYKLGRVLGVGGFGVTYAGRTVDSENVSLDVAVKEFLPSSLATREPGGTTVTALAEDRADDFERGLAAFVTEAQMLMRYQEDPHIVRVTGFVEANGTAYLVMPYYRGRSLQQLLAERGGTLPVGEAVEIMDAVLRGLGSVHAGGLVHRDIKPGNVYITNRKNVLILDFGAAREFVEGQTATHTRILSRGYAPPEQHAKRSQQAQQTDVYAAAATLYRSVTGEVPPEGTLRQLTDTLRPAHEFEGVSRRVSDVIATGLAVAPEERYQTAEAFRQALHAALSAPYDDGGSTRIEQTEVEEQQGNPPLEETIRVEGPGTDSEDGGGVPEVKRSRSLIPLAAVGVAAVVVAGWWAWGRPEPDVPSVEDRPVDSTFVAPQRPALYRAAVVAEGPDGFLSLRTRPTIGEGEAIARMGDRVRLEVLQCRDDVETLDGVEGSWCEVRIAASAATWVAQDDLVGAPEGGAGGVRQIASAFAPLYSRPNDDLRLLSLARGQNVSDVACEPQIESIAGRQSRWCSARIQTLEGWAFGGFLRVLGDPGIASLAEAVRENSPNPQPFGDRLAEATPEPAPPANSDGDAERPAPQPTLRPLDELLNEPDRPAPPPAQRATSSSVVVVDYTGRLADGTVFDSGVGVRLSLSDTMLGFRNGIAGMRVGESKRFVVPPIQAYGVRGLPPSVPPNATLTFDVTLREIQ